MVVVRVLVAVVGEVVLVVVIVLDALLRVAVEVVNGVDLALMLVWL